MTIPLVWSERVDNDPAGRLHDCTEASALMVLVAAGFTAFPLGAYTVAERQALDEASTRPANTGDMLADIDGAVATRYGVSLRKLAVTTTAALAATLAQPGRAYILAGSFGHFPVGHTLRPTSTTYTGPHAICVVTDPSCLVLDPLAPNRSAGVPVSPQVAAQFAWQNWECRYLALNELTSVADTATASPEDDMTTTITIHPLPAGSEAFFPVNVRTPLYDAMKPGGPVDYFQGRPDRESPAECTATVTIQREPLAAPWGTFRRVNVAGKPLGLLAQKDTVRLEVPKTTAVGPSEAEIASRIHDATQSVAAAAQAAADKF